MKIFAICGKTASGKSTLARNLNRGENYHLVKSYTTREERQYDPEDRETHIFVNNSFYEENKDKAIAMYDSPSGYHSWVDINSFKEGKFNIYVIDPQAVKNDLQPYCEAMGWDLITLYIDLPTNLRLERFVNREKTECGFSDEDHLSLKHLKNVPMVYVLNDNDVDSAINSLLEGCTDLLISKSLKTKLNKSNNKNVFYLLGDMLKKGSIKCREEEAQALRGMGIDLYSAIEQKDINDKKKQTVETNNKLAEHIFDKDTNAIYLSSGIVGEVDNNNVGSSVEIGQIAAFNWMWQNISDIVTAPISDIDKVKKMIDFLSKYPKKRCWFHTLDIRHTNLEEKGMRRSFSINQYLHGACLYLNSDGIVTFEEILEELKKLKIEN